jgi:hypothetical protein
MIILTSFKESVNLLKLSGFSGANCYSVARFQPKGFNYTDLPFLAAQTVAGKKIKLRGRVDPLNSYKHDLWTYYKTRWAEIVDWVESLDNSDVDMLCCWCPHASHSREQMRIYNSFVCHTGLVGKVINLIREDLDIYMDQEHSIHLVNEYKPMEWKMLVL